MKRIFSLAAAVILAALTVIAPVAHAGGGPVVFSMNSVENVAPGESFTVTLSISGDYQAHGMNLSIEFDPNSMTLESCDQGGYLDALRVSGGIPLLDAQTLAPSGKIKLGVMMPSSAATGSGEVLVMRFHVNEGVTVNQQVIMVIHEFIYMPIGQMTGTPIPFSTHNSIITLRGGTTPEAGYNEGDDGIGNNISSSPSQPPEPTPGGSTTTPKPVTTAAPGATNEPGTTTAPGVTPVPGNASSRTTEPPAAATTAPGESAQPDETVTASPDGTVTASPETSDEPANDTTEAPAGTETADANATGKPADDTREENGGDTKKDGKASPVPYVIAGAAAVGAILSAVAIINKKKRG